MSIHIADFIGELLKRRLNVLGVYVMQHGEYAGSFYWDDCFERRHNINSCAKSVVSLAVGIAAEEGLLRLDENVADAFFEEMPDCHNEWWDDLIIHDMLTMSTGHDSTLLPRIGRDELKNTDWVNLVLNQPILYPPGTYFQYNNGGPYLLSVLIEKRSGETLLNWLKPRLFTPLGINNPQWFTCPKGHTLGMGGLFLTTEELARIGQLCLQEGIWNGEHLIPPNYIHEATNFQVESVMKNYEEWPDFQSPDFQAGYGYFFWRNVRDNSYRGFGSGGQQMIVLPGQDAVISVIASDEKAQDILDSVWAGIVPQL